MINVLFGYKFYSPDSKIMPKLTWYSFKKLKVHSCFKYLAWFSAHSSKRDIKRGIITQSNFITNYEMVKSPNCINSKVRKRQLDCKTKTSPSSISRSFGHKSPTELRRSLKLWDKENLHSYKKFNEFSSSQRTESGSNINTKVEALTTLKPNSSYKLKLSNSRYLTNSKLI